MASQKARSNPAGTRRPKRVTCTNHCAGCGSHFHSLTAFEAHRQGEFGVERYCEEPADLRNRKGEPRLAPLSTDGSCLIYAHKPKHGVTIWTEAKAREHAGASFDG